MSLCVRVHGKACVYCQQTFDVGERYRAVFGVDSYQGHLTEAHEMLSLGEVYPEDVTNVTVRISNKKRLMRRSICVLLWCNCRNHHRSYVAHENCFDLRTILRPGKVTFQDIWDVGTLVQPWYRPLRDLIFKPSRAYLKVCLPRLIDSETKDLMQMLARLPEEVFRMIMGDWVGRSALARITLAAQFNDDLVRGSKGQTLPVALDSNSEQLETVFNYLGNQYLSTLNIDRPAAHGSVIRICVDHLGIRSAEILEEYPAKCELCTTEGLWYIVEDLNYAREHFEFFHNGPFLRISSQGTKELQLWDVADPPRSENCFVYRRFSKPLRRTRCIEMAALTGLTVFCTTSAIFGIHGHYGTSDSAISSYLNLSSDTQKSVTWRYLPLCPGESIVNAAIGIAYGESLVMITSRGRLCHFGCNVEYPSTYHVLCDRKLLERLLYDVPDSPFFGISWFGAVSRESNMIQVHPKSLITNNNLGYFCTYASLVGVDEAEIYREHKACTGVLFRYSDGSFEMLGERRVGLSTITTTRVFRPTKIHYRRFRTVVEDNQESFPRERIDIKFSNDKIDNMPLSTDWWYNGDMEGTAVWKFTPGEDIFEIRQEQAD